MAVSLKKRADGIITGADWDHLATDFLGEGRDRYTVSYVVYTDGTDAYAFNGVTGIIDYGGPNDNGGVDGASARAVIQAALDALTAGRDWREKIVVKGDFTIGSAIEIPAFTAFELRGKLTLADNADDNLIETDAGASYIEIFGGYLDGNKANQALAVHNISIGAGVMADDQIWIHDMQIYDAKGDGINAAGGLNNVLWVFNNRIGGNDRHGLGLLSVADSHIIGNQIGWSGNTGINIGSADNLIAHNKIWNSGIDGIYVALSSNILTDNRIEDNDRAGIYLADAADNCLIASNRIKNNGQDAGEAAAERAGIFCFGDDAIISDNEIYDSQTGVETQQHGISLSGATDCVVIGNKTFLHVLNGIFVRNASDRNIVDGNHSRDNGGNGISVDNSDFNIVCHNWLYNNVDWGVNVLNTSTSNLVKGNRFSGNVVGMLGDAGVNTKLATKAFCFVQYGGGSGGWTTPVINTTPGGIDIDANDEFAYVHITLPEELQEITRIKIWAYSNVVEATNNMLLRLVAHGATSNEAWSGNAVDVVNKESEETGGIAVGDVIHWVFDYNDDAQIGTLAEQDFMEILAVGEAASAPDAATDALFGGVEIEYV